MITFPTVATWSTLPLFSSDLVLQGSVPDPKLKGEPGHIWIEVNGQQDCLCFYGMVCQSEGPPLIYLEGDSSRRVGDGWAVFDGYASQSPAKLQLFAEQIATATQRTFINLARPGAYGSSGNHQHRRRPREVALIDAGISALKEAFGWQQIDLAGFSGGGHLVACLLARRSDIGRAVIASGNVAVRMRNNEQLRLSDVTGFNDFVDPIDLVDEVARHRPQQIIVLTDSMDRVVSATCQQAYVEALRRSGLDVDHRQLHALDENHHVLANAALFSALS